MHIFHFLLCVFFRQNVQDFDFDLRVVYFKMMDVKEKLGIFMTKSSKKIVALKKFMGSCIFLHF
jgi:predicted methyltransferase